MSELATGDRSATKAEVMAERQVLRRLASQHQLGQPRVDRRGTVIVHSDQSGYRSVRRFATAAAKQVGAWVNVITDDAPAAQVDAEPL